MTSHFALELFLLSSIHSVTQFRHREKTNEIITPKKNPTNLSRETQFTSKMYPVPCSTPFYIVVRAIVHSQVTSELLINSMFRAFLLYNARPSKKTIGKNGMKAGD